MFGYRPKNKDERLKLREFWLAGYNAVENDAADCLIATAENNGHYDLLIFDGTASRPCVNCSFRSADGRKKYIYDHVKGRLEQIKAKEARKQAKNSAGAYVVDESKPHFEVGREYCMEYYSDDPWPHTATIRIIKRTACFVTLSHVYGNREDEPRRVKVSVDERGEYLSYGSFYYFRASSCVEHDTSEEHISAQDATQISATADLLEAHTEAGRIVSVSVAPWLEDAVEARQKAAQERAQNVLDMVDMLTDEQLTAAVFTAPKDKPDVARFFLQRLAQRDEKKALAAFKAWQRGAGMEALDEI